MVVSSLRSTPATRPSTPLTRKRKAEELNSSSSSPRRLSGTPTNNDLLEIINTDYFGASPAGKDPSWSRSDIDDPRWDDVYMDISDTGQRIPRHISGQPYEYVKWDTIGSRSEKSRSSNRYVEHDDVQNTSENDSAAELNESNKRSLSRSGKTKSVKRRLIWDDLGYWKAKRWSELPQKDWTNVKDLGGRRFSDVPEPPYIGVPNGLNAIDGEMQGSRYVQSAQQDPARLARVLKWLSKAPMVRGTLSFAGEKPQHSTPLIKSESSKATGDAIIRRIRSKAKLLYEALYMSQTQTRNFDYYGQSRPNLTPETTMVSMFGPGEAEKVKRHIQVSVRESRESLEAQDNSNAALIKSESVAGEVAVLFIPTTIVSRSIGQPPKPEVGFQETDVPQTQTKHMPRPEQTDQSIEVGGTSSEASTAAGQPIRQSKRARSRHVLDEIVAKKRVNQGRAKNIEDGPTRALWDDEQLDDIVELVVGLVNPTISLAEEEGSLVQ